MDENEKFRRSVDAVDRIVKKLGGTTTFLPNTAQPPLKREFFDAISSKLTEEMSKKVTELAIRNGDELGLLAPAALVALLKSRLATGLMIGAAMSGISGIFLDENSEQKNDPPPPPPTPYPQLEEQYSSSDEEEEEEEKKKEKPKLQFPSQEQDEVEEEDLGAYLLSVINKIANSTRRELEIQPVVDLNNVFSGNPNWNEQNNSYCTIDPMIIDLANSQTIKNITLEYLEGKSLITQNQNVFFQ